MGVINKDDLISNAVKASALATTKASKSLRICCFGSSSSQTPEAYLKPSAEVGYLLAARGHVCVNGAGSYGCMWAINEGAVQGNGHIVGVIHEMWLKVGEDVKQQWGLERPLRDSGAHDAFAGTAPQSGSDSFGREKKKDGPIRELLVAGGKDLQERKALLIEKADALVVMPGGPGTFDELWEMACARNIGLSTIPIVCVNINGFYDPFRDILERAWTDKLTKLKPEQIMHFADTAEEAIRWLEQVQGAKPEDQVAPVKKGKKEMLRFSSVMGTPTATTGKTSSGVIDVATVFGASCLLAIGFVAGTFFSRKGRN